MVQPIHPVTQPSGRVRAVTPEALAAAYLRLFPAESRNIDSHAYAGAWLKKYEDRPEENIGLVGEQRQMTLVLFNALNLPLPNTSEMALFVVTHPDLERQATQIVYVSAKTPDCFQNVDLIVRAVSREHAEIAWRDYFDGWDLPARPDAITPIPVVGAPGAIDWGVFAGEAEDDSDGEAESQIPSL